jgi:hypothetical protein
MGYVCVLDNNKLFEENDIELAALICDVISAKMKEKDYFNDTPNLMFEDLFIDILNKKIHDSVIVSERLKYLNWENHDKYYVLAVDISKHDHTKILSHYVKDTLQKLIKVPTLISYGRYIVIIVGCKKENFMKRENFDALISYMKKKRHVRRTEPKFYEYCRFI